MHLGKRLGLLAPRAQDFARQVASLADRRRILIVVNGRFVRHTADMREGDSRCRSPEPRSRTQE